MARFWIAGVLVLAGMLFFLGALTHDGNVLAPAMIVAGTVEPNSMPQDDRALRRTTERRQQRVVATSSMQVETAGAMTADLGPVEPLLASEPSRQRNVPAPAFSSASKSTVSNEIEPAVAATSIGARARTAINPAKGISNARQHSRLELASYSNAGASLARGGEQAAVQVMPSPFLQSDASVPKTERVKIAVRKSAKTHKKTAVAPKRKVARRGQLSQGIWDRALRDGS